MPAIGLEDVYLTGIIAEKCNIERKDSKMFFRLDWKVIPIFPNKINSTLLNSKAVFSHDFHYKDIFNIWKNLINVLFIERKNVI